MKKIILPVMIIAIAAAYYEQSREGGNLYIVIISLIVFMLGMMRLSAKTPSKNPQNDDSDV